MPRDVGRSSGVTKTVTLAERPDLFELAREQADDTLPEYNHHGDTVHAYWSRLDAERPEFQFYVLGAGDEVLARGHSLPVRWDGSVDDLPAGIDGAIVRGFDDAGVANVLCAMLITIPQGLQGGGLSAVAVQAMRQLATRHSYTALLAPVRPNWKERYPLVPIERYAGWTRADGLLFDPWMRVHERAGATVLKPEPNSLRITGTVAEWEEWTKMPFPESGDYWFPGGLATVEIDRDANSGSYWEPNVWMHHAA
jgi:hypothetical protein